MVPQHRWAAAAAAHDAALAEFDARRLFVCADSQCLTACYLRSDYICVGLYGQESGKEFALSKRLSGDYHQLCWLKWRVSKWLLDAGFGVFFLDADAFVFRSPLEAWQGWVSHPMSFNCDGAACTSAREQRRIFEEEGRTSDSHGQPLAMGCSEVRLRQTVDLSTT